MRKLRDTEHPLVVVFYFPLVSIPASLPLLATSAVWPTPLEWLIRLNPLYYAIDGFRSGLTGVAANPLWLNLLIPILTVVALWLLAGHLIRRGWKLKA